MSRLLAAALLSELALAAAGRSLTVMTPLKGEKACQIAGAAFAADAQPGHLYQTV